jgi:DNA-binding NarL/FixJ family response regulator
MSAPETTAGRMVVVGEAVDDHHALDLPAELRPDVVLMDVSVPNMSGLEAAPVLTRHRSGVRVLILSSEGRCSVVQAARDVGAIGFLVRRTRGGDLVRAIRDAHPGRSTWPVCP